MKDNKAVWIFASYFALIGYACYLSDSAWPLLIMILVRPSFEESDDNEKKTK